MACPTISFTGFDRVVVLDGARTGFFVTNGTMPGFKRSWFIERTAYAASEVALFRTRRDVITAIGVFFEGATQRPDESEIEFWTRVMTSCMETGSTDRYPLSLEKQALALGWIKSTVDGKWRHPALSGIARDGFTHQSQIEVK